MTSVFNLFIFLHELTSSHLITSMQKFCKMHYCHKEVLVIDLQHFLQYNQEYYKGSYNSINSIEKI